MDNFWQDLKEAPTGDGFSVGGGDFEPIPKDTQVIALVDKVEWKAPSDYQPVEYINITWRIVDGEYKNRVVFQKCQVLHFEPEKKQKAIKMLANIDHLTSGGEVMRSGSTTAESMQSAFKKKPVLLTLEVWEVNGNSGNWVRSVKPYNRADMVAQAAQAATQPQPKPPASGNDYFNDDNIPF